MKYNHKLRCCCISCKIEITTANLGRHHHSCTQHLFPKPKKIFSNICKECEIEFDTPYKKQSCCSHKCAAINSNKSRSNSGYLVSDKTKKNISESLLKYHEKNTIKKPIKEKPIKVKNKPTRTKPLDKSLICGDYTTIYLCECKICKSKFFNKGCKQYCLSCHKESSNKRSRYKFIFNVFNFPELFDLELLKIVGFYSAGGKSKKWNIDGLSRDHKVSVSEALINDYDPYYITHPLNCQLMPHSENSKKYKKSSLSYDHLKNIVDEYETIKIENY